MTDKVFAEYSDKSIAAAKDQVRVMEQTIAKILKAFSDEFGVVVERIELDRSPDVYNQQSHERMNVTAYMVRLRTTL